VRGGGDPLLTNGVVRNVLIVCHTGVGIGLGHLTRSLVIARALRQELGATVRLLIQGDVVQHDDLSQFSHQFIRLGDKLIDAIDQAAHQHDVEVVVLDLYTRLVPTDVDALLRTLRHSGRKVISVDSLVGQRSNLDLMFIPSFRCPSLRDMSGATQVIFGWDCLLLNVKRSPAHWERGKNVLVLTGGSDATDLGKAWPTLLNESLPDGSEVHWVTGPYAKPPTWPFPQRITMIHHQSPSGLDDLMVDANYAVTIYGVSFYELLYYGVPTVVFSPYGRKDQPELAAIVESDIAIVAKDEVDAVSKLGELMRDDRMAGALSQYAQLKVSACGGHRLARAVASLMA